MTFSNDHIRRELRDIQRAHEDTRATHAAALDEAFDPASGVDRATKAELVGAPNRRQLLKLGGLTIASTALLAACVEPPSTDQVAVTGTIIPTPTTAEPQDPGSAEVDATLVLTAISLEKLAIAAYTAALDNNWLTAPLLISVAEYFRSQHEDHEGALAQQARRMGQNPDEVEPNPFLVTEVLDPAVEVINAGGGETVVQTLTLTLAHDLEVAAAQTYTKAGGILTTPTLRQAIMSIGGIEARHSAVLAVVLGEQPVPFALEPTAAAAPKEAFIAPNGPVTESPAAEDEPAVTEDPEEPAAE
jgi:hypothetical protein